MRPIEHVLRVIGLMSVAAAVLITLVDRTDVIFPDGVRYIEQAQRIDRGALREGLLHSTDHPGYPVVIALAHRALGGSEPIAWQAAAQAASVLTGVLLVIPLYLVVHELFGPPIAWLGVLLVYLTPVPSRVLADALSESTFLFFWCWGLWFCLRYLRNGSLIWLASMVLGGGLAYLTRPEGLLLPAALVGALLLMPFVRTARLDWPRWWAGVGVLVVGPLCIVGPYVVAKGGLGTKPALARVLGTAPRSASESAERSRPLDPQQIVTKTYYLAAKETGSAVAELVSLPLLPFVAVGLVMCPPARGRPRARILVTVIVLASILALMRLHATSGYCTARHALILGLFAIPAAGAGIVALSRLLCLITRNAWAERHLGLAMTFALVLAFFAWSAPSLLGPLNRAGLGYRLAAQWLEEHDPTRGPIVDLTGWAPFYCDRPGFTFANVHEAEDSNPFARYVVVREGHLYGHWGYCAFIRKLVGDRSPVAAFPEPAQPGAARVLVFDRMGQGGSEVAGAPDRPITNVSGLPNRSRR